MVKEKLRNYKGGRDFEAVIFMIQPRTIEILKTVRDKGPIRHGEIAEITGAGLSTVSYVLRTSRIKYKLVEYHDSISTDGNKKYILTKRGREALELAEKLRGYFSG